MQLNLLVLSYVASAALSAAVMVAALRRPSVVGSRGLALLMLAVAWWLLANALEATAVDRSTKIVWSVIAYPGIAATPVLYLLFVLAWTRQDGWVTPRRVAPLLIVPVISVGMAATNEWHHLLWPTVTLVNAWGVTAVYEHGPWFWVEVAYSLTLVGAGLLALVAAMYRYPATYRQRIRLAIAGSCAPIAASVLYATGLDASLRADLSSITFAITGLVAAWALLRGELLDLAPVAWATLVETLADAVLVLDPDRRIAAFNPSATRLLGIGDRAVGQAVDRALVGFDELAAVCREDGDREVEIQLTTGQAPAGGQDSSGHEPSPFQPASGPWLNIRVTAIDDPRGRDVGRLLVMRDVTERHVAMDKIRLLSLTDELTGLLNRRGFATLAEQQLLTAMRTRNRLWLLFADLDDLKGINDLLGHEAGDRSLREIARLLRTASFRAADIVARLGGDEFAVLATEISRASGETLGDRFKAAVARTNEAPDRECTLSVSVGVAVFDPEQPKTLDELIHEADRRMYDAKHARQSLAARPGALEASVSSSIQAAEPGNPGDRG